MVNSRTPFLIDENDLQPFRESQRGFLRKICETIAGAISNTQEATPINPVMLLEEINKLKASILELERTVTALKQEYTK